MCQGHGQGKIVRSSCTVYITIGVNNTLRPRLITTATGKHTNNHLHYDMFRLPNDWNISIVHDFGKS